MSPMITQLIAGILLLLIGIFVFKKFPLKINVKSLVLVSLFIVLSNIMSMISLKVPLFGFDSLRIGFGQIMLVIGGALIAPGYAYIMGIVADVIGLIMNPTNYPFLGFTLNSVLACLIPSLWYNHRNKLTGKNIMLIVDGFLLLLLGLASVYIVMTPSIKVNKEIIEFTLGNKILAFALCDIVSLTLIFMLHFIKNKLPETTLSELSNWMFVVLLIEVFIQFISTPIWMQAMYGIPWAASLFLRIVKACVMVPLNVLIGYFVLRTVHKIKL